jgi:hypothetical protein
MGDKSGGGAVALTLDSRGFIRDCDAASEVLFKYCHSEIVRHHISALLPQLRMINLVLDGQPNEHLRFLSRIGYHFLAVTQDGDQFPSRLFINVLDAAGIGRLSLLVRPANLTAYQVTRTKWDY